MKLKNILTAIASSALLFAGCTQEYEISTLDEIKVSQSYICIPADGSATHVSLETTVSWELVSEVRAEDEEGDDVLDEGGNFVYEKVALPEWLTVSQTSGSAGEFDITFSAEALDDPTAGRELNLAIWALDDNGNPTGIKQYLIIRQGEIAASEATCQEVIDGPDGKTYIVTGTCTVIKNTQYGNWRLADETGEILIYGTVTATGQYDWESFNIEVGDIVTVQGPKTTYNGTVELVDAKVLAVEKSLLTCETPVLDITKEGGDVVGKFVVKGDGFEFDMPSDVSSWASVMNIATIKAEDSADPDTTAVTIRVAPNEGEARSGVITFTSSSSDGSSSASLTINQSGPSFIYTKVSAVESGKKYLLVSNGGAFTLPDTGSYGYPENTPVTVENNSIELFNDDLAFEFTSKDGGYTIMSKDKKYIYQTGTYNSFNWSTSPSEGDVWSVAPQADGTFKIMNVSVQKWIQYSESYESWGSYSTDSGPMPELYVLTSAE